MSKVVFFSILHAWGRCSCCDEECNGKPESHLISLLVSLYTLHLRINVPSCAGDGEVVLPVSRRSCISISIKKWPTHRLIYELHEGTGNGICSCGLSDRSRVGSEKTSVSRLSETSLKTCPKLSFQRLTVCRWFVTFVIQNLGFQSASRSTQNTFPGARIHSETRPFPLRLYW